MATDGSSRAQPLDTNNDVRQEVNEDGNRAIQQAHNAVEGVSTSAQVSPADTPSQQDEDEDDDDHLSLYKHVRMLGHGGSASVEMVRHSKTGSVFARKIIRNVYSRNMEDAKRKLLNEVQIMQRLSSHRHIAKVHATYIKGRELAIILEPVADSGDLANFLQNFRDESFTLYHPDRVTRDRRAASLRILKMAFGCLASALAFIHQQTIRHKDIKPQNILIHQERVMYTDFGLSYDYADIGRSTTSGNPQGFTRRYCAPEVAKGESRNSKSDIFSLGCVFIEICLALVNDASYDEVYRARPFHELVQSHPHGLPLPLFNYTNTDQLLNDVLGRMLSSDSASRPSASSIAYLVIEGALHGFSCSECKEVFQFT